MTMDGETEVTEAALQDAYMLCSATISARCVSITAATSVEADGAADVSDGDADTREAAVITAASR